MAHGDRSVDVFVRKLRQKLEAASPGWRYIHTHFGIGYRFQPETDETVPVPDASAGAIAPAAGDGLEPDTPGGTRSGVASGA